MFLSGDDAISHVFARCGGNGLCHNLLEQRTSSVRSHDDLVDALVLPEGGQMAVPAFTTPFTYPSPFSPWGISPQQQPLLSAPLSSTFASSAYGAPPLQQVLPLLQIVPQQLQHLQQLVSVQLQELQQLQQIIQLLPAQLQQIQQLIQFVPQQLQQLQQPQFQQGFGPAAGLTGFASTPWGVGPLSFGAQPSQVM
jgi:hypothetical protein